MTIDNTNYNQFFLQKDKRSVQLTKKITIIKQYVKANLKDHYYLKLCHSSEFNHLFKKIVFYCFSHILVSSKNTVCHYG